MLYGLESQRPNIRDKPRTSCLNNRQTVMVDSLQKKSTRQNIRHTALIFVFKVGMQEVNRLTG